MDKCISDNGVFVSAKKLSGHPPKRWRNAKCIVKSQSEKSTYYMIPS